WGDTECLNGPAGNAETYLAADVPAWAAAHPDVAPASWAVAGLSEGGYCAAHLALAHPRLFSAFGDFSGEVRPHFDFGAPAAPGKELRNATLAVQLAEHPPVAAWFETSTGDRDDSNVRA